MPGSFEVEPLKEPPHVTRVLDEQAFFICAVRVGRRRCIFLGTRTTWLQGTCCVPYRLSV